MRLACVLLNYNELSLTLDAITRAKQIDEIEAIIVIDNCSPKEDFEVLKNLANEKIKVFKTNHNGGYGFGNNTGIKIAADLGFSHAVVANPDVIFDSQCIQKTLKVFSSFPKCGIAAPVTFYRGKPCFSRLPTPKELLLESSSLYTRIYGKKTEEQIVAGTDIQRCDEVVGAMLIVDIKKMLHCLYDERFFLYCEELVLGYKMKEMHYETYVVTDVSYIHQLSKSIDNEYHGLYEKRKISNRSKLMYLKYYLKVSGGILFLSKIWFLVLLLEAKLIDIFKEPIAK